MQIIINSSRGLHLLEKENKITNIPFIYFDYNELKVNKFHFQKFKEIATLIIKDRDFICNNCEKLFEFLDINLNNFNQINLDRLIKYKINLNCKDYIGILFSETVHFETISIYSLKEKINMTKFVELIDLFNKEKVLILKKEWLDSIFIKEKFINETLKDIYNEGWEIYEYDIRTLYNEYDYPVGKYYVTRKFDGKSFVKIKKSKITSKALKVFKEIKNKYNDVFVENILPLNTLEKINYWRNYYKKFKGGEFDEFSPYTCEEMKKVILNEIKFTLSQQPLLEFIKNF